jgi:diguanylate cyclase
MNAAATPDIDFDQATAMAGRALQLMAEHNVPATPQNFEVWFSYARGSSPELNKVVNILIANKRGFDAATSHSLYLSYVVGEAGPADKHAEISNQLHTLMSSAQGYLATSVADNRDHVAALGGVASQIEEETAAPGIIRNLIAELSRAVGRASALEANFTASLQELDKIRGTLAAVEQRSKTDALTGLANRHALDEFLRVTQMAAMENGRPLTILLIDVDHFKQFNDKFGHQFGDQVLRLIAAVLKNNMRGEDLAARFGGEELVGVMPGSDIKLGATVAERIRQAIATREVRRRGTSESLAKVSVSIGVAQFVPGETLASLFERCDRALYAAKRGGRNRVVTELELEKGSAPVSAG